MKILVIQYPPNKDTGKPIHPIRVDMETGQVLDQHRWHGQPYQLIGFTYKGQKMVFVKPEEIVENQLSDLEKHFSPQFFSWTFIGRSRTQKCVSLDTMFEDYTLSIEEVKDEDSCNSVST